MPQGNPKQGELYRHFKNKMYQIVAIATHSETREAMVVYQALYGDYRTYVRPYDMFISEVDHVKYPEVADTYRFTYVEREKGVEGLDWNEQAVKTVQMPIASEMQKIEEPMPTAPRTESDAPDETAGINPAFLAFLDTDDLNEKYEILCNIDPDEIDDRLVDNFAVAMDVVVPEEGDVGARFAQLKQALHTRLKFENTRLR